MSRPSTSERQREKTAAGKRPPGVAGFVSELREQPWLLGVGLVMIVVAAIGLYRIGDPVGGYHSGNEGFYSDLAYRHAEIGPLSPITAPIDGNNPPLYTVFATLALSLLGGPPVVATRLVSLIASVLTIPLVFGLARTLYNERVGLMTTVVWAFMPGVMLVGRNTQVESLMILLQVAAVLCYALAVHRSDIRLGAAAGILLGLAVLTKLTSILILPALAVWQLWRTRGLRWLPTRLTAFSLLGFLVGGFWWWLYQTATAEGFFEGIVGLTTRARGAQGFEIIVQQMFWRELTYAMSPVLGVVAIVAVLVLLAQRRAGDKLVLVMILTFVLWYWAYHFHTYYMYPVTPWLALAVARGLYAIQVKSWPRVAAIAGALAVVLLFYSVVELSAKKWGVWGPSRVDPELASIAGDPSRITLLADGHIVDNSYGPAFWNEIRLAHAIHDPPRGEEKPKPGTRPIALGYSFQPERYGPRLGTAMRTLVRPVVFGWAIETGTNYPHFFYTDRWLWVKVGPPWRFGLDPVPRETQYAYYEPAALEP